MTIKGLQVFCKESPEGGWTASEEAETGASIQVDVLDSPGHDLAGQAECLLLGTHHRVLMCGEEAKHPQSVGGMIVGIQFVEGLDLRYDALVERCPALGR